MFGGRENTAGAVTAGAGAVTGARAVTTGVGEDTEAAREMSDSACGAGEVTTGTSGDEAKISDTECRDKEFFLEGSSRKTSL